MKKRILFISIFDLTQLFHAVGSKLRLHGHEIYWMTTNEYWTDWLVSEGVARPDILQLVYHDNDFVDDDARAKLTNEIVKTEAAGELSINQVLQMDRFVMSKNKPDINEYVHLYYRDIKRFLKEKRISHVFAEPTNTNEMIAYMLCRELGIPFLSVRDMRYPRGRLIFNEGYLQGRLVGGGGDAGELSGKAQLEEFAHEKTTPYYFKRNTRMRAIDPGKIAVSVRNRISRLRYSRQNLTHHDLSERTALLLKRALFGFYMRHVCRYAKLDSIKGEIAYFGLHVQPEASIDVLGPYFSDQLKLIKDIRRALPFDVTLVVKEHPNFLGIKPLSLFRKIKRIPGVELVRHSVSSFDLYKRAAIVFTVSGTPAYEAGMLGIPAIVFSPMYFDGLSAVRHCPDVSGLKDLVYSMLNDFAPDYESDSAFMEEMIRRSYLARWANPQTSPWVLERDNVERLTAAFLDVTERTSISESESQQGEVEEIVGDYD